MMFQFFKEIKKKKREILNVTNAVIKWIVFSDKYVDIFEPNSMATETVIINTFPFFISTCPCL